MITLVYMVAMLCHFAWPLPGICSNRQGVQLVPLPPIPGTRHVRGMHYSSDVMGFM